MLFSKAKTYLAIITMQSINFNLKNFPSDIILANYVGWKINVLSIKEKYASATIY